MLKTSNASHAVGLQQHWLGGSWRNLVLLLLAGALQALALAWPFEGGIKGEPMGWLQFVGFLVLAALVDRSSSPKQAAWQGWWFALAWLLSSTWWLFISLHTYGELAAPLAVAAVSLP